MYELMSLVIAPLFVGLVIILVDHWLDDLSNKKIVIKSINTLKKATYRYEFDGRFFYLR